MTTIVSIAVQIQSACLVIQAVKKVYMEAIRKGDSMRTALITGMLLFWSMTFQAITTWAESGQGYKTFISPGWSLKNVLTVSLLSGKF